MNRHFFHEVLLLVAPSHQGQMSMCDSGSYELVCEDDDMHSSGIVHYGPLVCTNDFGLGPDCLNVPALSVCFYMM